MDIEKTTGDLSKLPVWDVIRTQEGKSQFIREPLLGVECKLKVNGETYLIEAAKTKDDITAIHQLLLNNFDHDEVEPADVLSSRVLAQATPEITYKHQAFAVKDATGELVSAFVGVHLDLRDDLNRPTGETVYAIGYIATNLNKRFNDLAREVYVSALIDASLEAETWGKKLVMAFGECTSISEPFWNAAGLKRPYRQDDPKIYNEVRYWQEPHEFDPESGAVAAGAGRVPEHLMAQRFGTTILTKERLFRAVMATYRELYIQPREAFANNEAYQKHLEYMTRVINEFRQEIFGGGQLIFLDEGNRARAMRAGITVHDHITRKP